jgi:hypothetical protein
MSRRQFDNMARRRGEVYAPAAELKVGFSEPNVIDRIALV